MGKPTILAKRTVGGALSAFSVGRFFHPELLPKPVFIPLLLLGPDLYRDVIAKGAS